MKLDSISSVGTFMTYKGTDKIVYVVDKEGKNEKSSAHVLYNEAHMSANICTQLPMATALQQAGYRKEPYSDPNPLPVPSNKLRIQLQIFMLRKEIELHKWYYYSSQILQL